jgi:hypothetical protein
MFADPDPAAGKGEAGTHATSSITMAGLRSRGGWRKLYRSSVGASKGTSQRHDGAACPQSPFDLARRERRIVIIADWLPPDFGAVGQYMQMRAEALAERGHDVTLVGLTARAGSTVRADGMRRRAA